MAPKKKLSEDYNLAVLYPHLAKEWDYEKNELKPEEVTPGSGRNIWWKCNLGHSWRTAISHRAGLKSGCPLCSSRLSTSKREFRLFCELSYIFLDAQWRRKIDNIECDIYLPSHGVAVEYDGFYWHSNRAEKDREKGENLRNLGVTLFRLREPGLTPISCRDVIMDKREISVEAIKRLVFIIRKSIFLSKSEHNLCRNYLKTSKFLRPQFYNETAHTLSIPKFKDSVAADDVLKKEWDYSRNKNKPEMFPKGSHEKVWWKGSCGHSWFTPIYYRALKGTGCPECNSKKVSSHNRLSDVCPGLLLEWDYDKNIDVNPSDVMVGSGKRVWWRCKNGHSWQAIVQNRCRKGHGCPECSGLRVGNDNNLLIKFPVVAAEWDYEKNGNLTPLDVTAKSGKRVWWKCKYGHRWQSIISHRSNGSRCPFCSRQKRGAHL
jgi:very-short-patch-repair endonuclease